MKRLALLAVLGGCGVVDFATSSFETNDFSGDEFPTYVDRTSGGVVVGLQEGKQHRTAVLDVLSPMTLIDRGPDARVSIDDSNLVLLGARGGPTGELDLPRAAFTSKQVVTLHPCKAPVCEIGTPTAPRAFDAIVGLDAFSSDALRLRLGDDQVFILPDIAGSELHRSRACDAVLPSPFRGGGTIVLGGTELGFSNWRIAIDTCIAFNPDQFATQDQRGSNALLVVSTAIGISILSESAYARYRELDDTIPEVTALPESQVNLPSGVVSGHVTTLPSLALVGNSSGYPRAPCRQMWASHLLASRNCRGGDDCPCSDNDTFCPTPAIVEVSEPVSVLVVADSNPTLQALRTELRPDRPEVDGILGTDALRALELDIDYAHDRLVARCTDRSVCAARPVLADLEARTYVNGCLGTQAGTVP
jgi:hypothetical protein